MRIYEIDERITELLQNVDPETGEVMLDYDELDALQMERDAKIEALALHIKNRVADSEAIGAEVKRLETRKKVIDNEVSRLKNYLLYVLKGNKFETPKVLCSFRRTKKVECDPDFIAWAVRNAPDLLRQKDPEPNKTEIKKRLEKGEEIPFTALSESYSTTVK